jgi:hypothetical protein
MKASRAADAPELVRLWLRVGGERPQCEAECENDHKPDPPHEHLGEDGCRGV